MTKHLDLHFFTPEELHEHDLTVATEVMKVVTKNVLDQVQKMSPSQIVNASRDNGSRLFLPPEDISDVVSTLRAKREKRFGTQ